jgi:hypothetical protein
MLCIDASSAARASAICRSVSGECGREDGDVEVVGLEAGTEELDGPGWGGESDGALVLVEADAEADAEAKPEAGADIEADILEIWSLVLFELNGGG